MNSITLPSGTVICEGLRVSIIVPEIAVLSAGETVDLLSKRGERLAQGVVIGSEVAPFSHLQREHFAFSANASMNSWPNALEFLQKEYPGFGQNERVTFVDLTYEILLADVEAEDEEEAESLIEKGAA